MSGPCCSGSQHVSTNLLPTLLRREVGWKVSAQSRDDSIQFYGCLFPDASAKLRTANATSVHFSPCGNYVLGIKGHGHTVSIWTVDSFMSNIVQYADKSSQHQCVPASSAAGPSRAASQPQIPDIGTTPSSRPSPQGASQRRSDAPPVSGSAGVARNYSYAMLAATPGLAFAESLKRDTTPASSWRQIHVLGKRHFGPWDGADGVATSQSGAFPPPVEEAGASIIEEARRVLCLPPLSADDTQLRQLWERRGREQQAMIASWNQSRKRLRQSRILPISKNSFVSLREEPPQPKVVTAPCRRPVLKVCSSDAPEGVFSPGEPGVVAYVTAGDEKLSDSTCLFTEGCSHVLLLTESQPHPASGDPATSTSTASSCSRTSIVMVCMRSGTVVDRIQFTDERLVLRANRSCVSWSLCGNTLIVLAPRAQRVHIYHVLGNSLLHNRTLHKHVRHDDELVISNLHAEEEQYRCRHCLVPHVVATLWKLPGVVIGACPT
jgi:De-etiolated protein 1 Det1